MASPVIANVLVDARTVVGMVAAIGLDPGTLWTVRLAYAPDFQFFSSLESDVNAEQGVNPQQFAQYTNGPMLLNIPVGGEVYLGNLSYGQSYFSVVCEEKDV